ncbi:MAG TPA: tail fiber protein [Verrucomicrobiae bacterium]|nr:tail fiber protein [Verrucomicrobiae bacterium]
MEAYLGEIRMFAGTFAPQGWHLCDGALLPVNGNEALFALLGTTFGGNGTTDFGVPDLRGRVPISMGQGTGLQLRTLGATGGTETVTLTDSQNPSHSHSFSTVNTPGTAVTPDATMTLAAAPEGDYLYVNAGAAGTTSAQLNSGAITSAGGSQAHTNIMPSLAATFIICTVGVFPTQG